MESKGLGDLILSVTVVTGVKKIVDKFSGVDGEPCQPCQRRKDALNDPNLLVNKIFFKDNVQTK